MDIKSWILLIGTLLIVAVICHGFWTAYQARKNDVRVDLETDIPEDDLDEMVLLRGELPNGGARVTPTVGFEALRMKERVAGLFGSSQAGTEMEASVAEVVEDPLDEQIALDDAAAVAQEGFAQAAGEDEGNRDAGYEPEQATLDLDITALEERYAARIAAAQTNLSDSEDSGAAPLLTDAELPDAELTDAEVTDAELTDAEAQVTPTSQLPPKKLIGPDQSGLPRRKQFEPPLPEEVAAMEALREIERVQAEKEQAARERAEAQRVELEAAARKEAEREAAYNAKVEAQRIARLEAEERETQARAEAAARAEAKARARARAEKQAREQAIADQTRRAQAEKARQQAEKEAEAAAAALEALPTQLSLTADPVVEFSEVARGGDSRRGAATQEPSTAPVEELVVLNVIAKSRPFHGGDVLELFLRNGIKFGDMNIFHRIDPVTKASQYSIASVTEPGYFDLSTMEQHEFRGLCLFMQLPCVGQPTKVFTDMLTVAEKLARQLDAEVCDEQYNRLTRQSTEHFRQRVAEFTRRHMSKRAQS